MTPARGSGQEVFEISRVGLGRVGTGWVGSGRIGSDQEVFEISRIGFGLLDPTRSDPTRPDPRSLTRHVNSPAEYFEPSILGVTMTMTFSGPHLGVVLGAG